nr:HNH endonuclease [Cutibacterium granulosum]
MFPAQLPEPTHNLFCEQHAKAEDEHYRKWQRAPMINRRYGARWRKIRTVYITAHPFCENCLADGRYTLAQESPPRDPQEHGGTHDFTNLCSLCKPCHSRQSALDGDRWRQTPKVYTY